LLGQQCSHAGSISATLCTAHRYVSQQGRQCLRGCRRPVTTPKSEPFTVPAQLGCRRLIVQPSITTLLVLLLHQQQQQQQAAASSSKQQQAAASSSKQQQAAANIASARPKPFQTHLSLQLTDDLCPVDILGNPRAYGYPKSVYASDSVYASGPPKADIRF